MEYNIINKGPLLSVRSYQGNSSPRDCRSDASAKLNLGGDAFKYSFLVFTPIVYQMMTFGSLDHVVAQKHARTQSFHI